MLSLSHSLLDVMNVCLLCQLGGLLNTLRRSHGGILRACRQRLAVVVILHVEVESHTDRMLVVVMLLLMALLLRHLVEQGLV